MTTPPPNPATNPAAVLYRRTLIDLDKDRARHLATGSPRYVIDALDHYRTTLQTALHKQGVTQ